MERTGKRTIIGEALPNIPWEERPADERFPRVVWRSARNPIIPET